MAWHVAADRVLSDWDTLVLRDNRGWPVVAGKNQIWLQNDAETWIKRLEHLVRLKRIFVTGDRIGSKLLPVVHDVVVRNAASLTLLHMRSELMPFGPRGTVFHNLRDLDCSVVYFEQVACPRLQKLRASTAVHSLHQLPADTLISLHMDDLFFVTESHEAIEQLVAACSRFTRLKRLILGRGLRFFPGCSYWIKLHDQAISQLFTNLKEMVEVDILFPERYCPVKL